MSRLSPVYETLEPNSPIPLYQGEMTLGPDGTPDEGLIRFDWLPTPKARFEIPEASRYFGADDVTLSLPDSNGETAALVTEASMGDYQPTSISGILKGPMEFGSGTNLFHLIFHLTNFEYISTGREAARPAQLSGDWEVGDILLDADGWLVRIEAVPHIGGLERLFKTTGGYAVTHVGRLEREDGSPFSSAEANEMLGTLRYFLSFVRGSWVALILPVGFDDHGIRRWEQWGSWKLDSWRSCGSWCDSQHGECLAPALRGFVSRWRDDLWHESIRLALHWYIEANRGGSDVEAYIVLTQACLDMIAGTLFVEDLQQATVKDFENASKYPAKRKVGDLLRWAGIPTDLPTLCVGLTAIGPIVGFSDGPEAFATTRNWIGHPTKKNRAKFSKLSSQAINDASRLGLRYLELILLRLFDYSGTHANRLVRPRYSGSVEPVPWAE